MFVENINCKSMIEALLDNNWALAYITDPQTYELLYVSPAFEEYFKTPLLGKKCYQQFYNLHQPCQSCQCHLLGKEPKATSPYEIYHERVKRYYSKSHKLIDWQDGRKVNFVYSIDITDWKLLQQRLQEKQDSLTLSEKQYRTIFESTGCAMAIVEEDMTLSLVNNKLESLFGYTADDVVGKKKITDFLFLDQVERIRAFHMQRRINPELVPANYDTTILDNYGKIRHVNLTVNILPGTRKTIVSLLDITERKEAEDRLKYLSFHDSLTGVYNRRYFEEEVERLNKGQSQKVAVIICDVDGLKFINDTFGNTAGDSVLIAFATILKKNFLEFEHMVARIGGDEFVVIAYGINEFKVEAICNRIRQELRDRTFVDSTFKINASIGYALRGNSFRKVEDVLKEADDKMSREKLFHAESRRSSIVQTLEKALETRDFVTEGHADRLQDLITELAVKVGYSKSRLADLRLLGKFHDIGKVGTPDRILFKKGQLNPEERAEMRRHSEMGYKIAQSSPDLMPIADWILKHHENWDGTGYPLGLTGNQIPLECRMLSIVDAYDAMTNDRPYRQAMTHEEAVAELKRCSGSQFDPVLVASFI